MSEIKITNSHDAIQANDSVTEPQGDKIKGLREYSYGSNTKYKSIIQLPIPEPRKRSSHSIDSLSRKSNTDIRNVNGLKETIADDVNPSVKLVNIRNRTEDNHHHQEDLEDSRAQNRYPVQMVVESRMPIDTDRTEHNEDLATNETNILVDELNKKLPILDDLEDNYEEGIVNDEDYYEYEFEPADRQDELTNLSRQSMVPLHELIAYYQYIQQGDQVKNTKDSVSRQSSSASQQTTRTKHSYKCELTKLDDCKSSNRSIETIKSQSDSQNSQTPNVIDWKEEVETSKVPIIQLENVPISPSDTKEIINTEEALETLNSEQEYDKQDKEKKLIAAKEERRRIRANVVLELINSERDFVKHLKDVVEGYLYPARSHPEIFTGERINTIFANIEQLYEFQRTFLNSLEICINWDDLAESEVGECFLNYERGFSVYHYYCNNHPNATSELQDLYTKPRFVKFFEACRLLQNMIDISLDGFLLTPIQKICKYPLQLNELLRNTDQDHPDYQNVSDALESMRNCANLANERKRRIEALADVMSFQEKVDNWFGPKLSDTSSILLHSGEVSKMTSHSWSQGIQLYLFDHLLILSKKDLLKRNSLILKGRICMDRVTEISDADEYKPKKSFKLYCGEQQRWFVFTTRNEKERDEWIRAFEHERNLVETDEIDGFRITEREIGVARRALQNRKHSRSARYRHKRPDTTIVDQLDLDDANTIMNRTLSLPSCIHPSHVMNFVEDSRVISSSRKSKPMSPNFSSRSPASGSQNINYADQSNQESPETNLNHSPLLSSAVSSTGTSWFRKMGSKKLSKSQVYNINGSNANSSTQNQTVASSIKTRASSPSAVMDVSSAVTKYDQLEKRHRDHMVSEEQARLFRLNNDLPLPVFGTMPTSPSQQMPNLASGRHSIAYSSQYKQQIQPSPQSLNSSRFSHSNITDAKSNLNTSFRASDITPEPSGIDPNSRSTYETTVVLSSGRVVRVREDAV